jgi:hypothetical protein
MCHLHQLFLGKEKFVLQYFPNKKSSPTLIDSEVDKPVSNNDAKIILYF